MRYFLIVGGCLSFALGILGAALPILPTTPFLLLSGFCFARSSERFHQWLQGTKIYQSYVADYAETKTIARDTKKRIAKRIALLMTISIVFVPLWPVRIALFLWTVFMIYYLFNRIPDK
ncbi:YbaN family protein [Aerococcus kribbianus]|uniref:YbaN family protein n=1 Tax=Aerococcus kribbianus TaxID=2999064 RepID=A0A9X3FNZ1_9LACT|nr:MULTISPECIES: YbaN family protein [unclassified Aerococcus]MCZ0717911.1 YbaN family protein [Aerococcus sp. YH-aer221]MCZ0726198.1 YbaN family protein [Aerococcus sp. YH-aer222]